MRSDRIFKTDHLKQNLKGSAVRGGSFTVGAQGFRFALRLASTAILARLLSPEDYGLIGMTMVVSGFVGIVRDGGLIHATIQKESITHEETSLLFWINVLIGIGIACIIVFLSPFVAMVFDEPRLTTLLWALAVPFLFGGCSVQHNALLQRQMKFGKIAIIEIFSAVGGIAVAIALAYQGFGYWALAWMEIVRSLISMVLAWSLLLWIPSLPKRTRGILSTLRFGGNIVLFNIVNYISRNADNALIGWYWGAASLGLYSRAYSLLLLPIRNINAPFGAVAIPVLSRVKDEPVKLKKYFLEAVAMVAAVVIPIVACGSVFADDLVRIWLGPQWMDTAGIFRLLAIPALLFGASQPITWLYIVLNRTDLLRNVGLVMAPITVSAFCIGLPYGPEGVALSYTISSSLLFIPVLRYALRDTNIAMWDVFLTWRQPLISALIGGGVGLLIRNLARGELSQFLLAFVSIGSFGITYGLLMCFVFGWKKRALAWFAKKGAKAVPRAVIEAN